VNTTPKTDIFHLGMVLWLLAENITPISAHHFCRSSNCQRPAGIPCHELHADPIALPPLSSYVPQYYKDIVSHCRATNPSSRPSAWRLLQLFPRGTTHTDIQKSPNTLSEEIKTLIWMSRSVPENIYCGVCGDCYQDDFLHCNTCLSGDWDLCIKCFERGLHCLDREHYLVKMTSKQGWLIASSDYHSCLKGQERDVIQL